MRSPGQWVKPREDTRAEFWKDHAAEAGGQGPGNHASSFNRHPECPRVPGTEEARKKQNGQPQPSRGLHPTWGNQETTKKNGYSGQWRAGEKKTAWELRQTEAAAAAEAARPRARDARARVASPPRGGECGSRDVSESSCESPTSTYSPTTNTNCFPARSQEGEQSILPLEKTADCKVPLMRNVQNRQIYGDSAEPSGCRRLGPEWGAKQRVSDLSGLMEKSKVEGSDGRTSLCVS